MFWCMYSNENGIIVWPRAWMAFCGNSEQINVTILILCRSLHYWKFHESYTASKSTTMDLEKQYRSTDLLLTYSQNLILNIW